MDAYRLISILSSSILILIVACKTNPPEPKYTKWVNDSYSEFIQADDTLFSTHFPRSVEASRVKHFSYSTKNDMRGFPEIYLALHQTTNEIDTLEKRYLDKKYPLFNAGDTNLLVINTWKSLKESGFSVDRDEEFKEKLMRLGKLDYPIPNFRELKLDNGQMTPSQLSSDFDIIVIDARKGLFGEFDELSDRRYIPKEWEHGFSKGIAFSKQQKMVIYWVAMW